jgi:hypothetical protein
MTVHDIVFFSSLVVPGLIVFPDPKGTIQMHHPTHPTVCVIVRVRMYVCVRVLVIVRVCICVCVCMCVLVRVYTRVHAGT